MKTPMILFYVIAAAAVTIFITMNVWTVPAISAQAGGLQVFDNLPFGYDLEFAHKFMSRLTDDGLAIYLGIQKYLDTFFPVLMAVSLTWALWMLTTHWQMVFRIMIMGASVFGPLFDLCENASVRVMLYSGAEALTPSMVDLASTFSRMKWTLDLTAMAAFLLLLWSHWLKRREAKRVGA